MAVQSRLPAITTFSFSYILKISFRVEVGIPATEHIAISETGESSALAIPWSVPLVVFCSLQLQRKVSNQYIRSV